MRNSSNFWFLKFRGMGDRKIDIIFLEQSLLNPAKVKKVKCKRHFVMIDQDFPYTVLFNRLFNKKMC